MDPKPPATRVLLAPASNGSSAAIRLPPRETPLSPDDHLVTPEVTRDELIRGRRVVAMPALPPHADQQFGLGYVIGAHVKPGFTGSAELLTRVSEGSDFATDVCVRKSGTNPETGARYLEELAFEVVNEQSLRDITEKAEDLTRRGVRRVIAIFVKKGEVCEWVSGAFRRLDPEAILADPTLARPLRVRALIDAAEADDAVAQALLAKHNPVLVKSRTEAEAKALAAGEAKGLAAGEAKGLRAAVRDLCEVLAIPLTPEREDTITKMTVTDLETLRERIKRDRRWD